MSEPRVWHDGPRRHDTIDIVPHSAKTGPPVWPSINQRDSMVLVLETWSCSVKACLYYSEKSLVVQSKHACIWVDKPPSIILEALINNVTLFLNQ